MISMFVFLFPFVVNAAELQQQTLKALERVRAGRELLHAAAARQHEVSSSLGD